MPGASFSDSGAVDACSVTVAAVVSEVEGRERRKMRWTVGKRFSFDTGSFSNSCLTKSSQKRRWDRTLYLGGDVIVMMSPARPGALGLNHSLVVYVC